MQIDRDLDGEFVKQNNITQFIILEEPKIPDNGFNSTVKARVQCNDTKETIGIWTINKQSKNSLIDKFGNETIKMAGTQIPILSQPYGRGKLTINVNKEKLMKEQTILAE